MPRRLVCLLLAATALGWWDMARAQAPGDDAALGTVGFLKGLVEEASIGLQIDVQQPSEFRLFHQQLDDGRSWIEFLADDLATRNNWAAFDQAVSLLLNQADEMKRLGAEEGATPKADHYSEARKLFLEAAAELLARYRTAAGDVFDEAVTAQGDLSGDPDWELPGGVELREIAGGGLFNTRTNDFSGRLSGLLLLPGLDAALAVPNFSFDSMGNVDLTAWGQAAFPPGEATQVTLQVPPRRPLNMHFDQDGGFSIGGTAILGLPDGNTFEGYFAVDDPRYAFGLEFSGSLTLELAKELTLVRPVITYDPDNPLTLEAIDGVGRFFGSLGQGLETFVGELPELPPIDESTIGQPPEFENPPGVIPFDAVDAFFAGIVNDVIRPAINGPVDGVVQALRGLLDGWQEDVIRQRNEGQPTIDSIQRVRRLVEEQRKAAKALADAGARQALGEEGADELLDKARKTLEDATFTTDDYLRQLPANAEIKTGMAATRAAIEARAAAAGAGSTMSPDLSFALPKFSQWEATELAKYGFLPDGGIADQDIIDKLTAEDLQFLLKITYRFAGEKGQLGNTEPNLVAAREMARRLLIKLADEYHEAVAEGDLETRAVAAVKLLDLSNLKRGLDFQVGAEDLTTAQNALVETIEEVAQRTSKKTASSLIRAARNVVKSKTAVLDRRLEELFGDRPGRTEPRDLGGAAPLRPPTEGKNFQEKLADHLDNPSITNLPEAQAALEKVLEGDLANLAERFARSGLEDSEFERSFDDLCEIINNLALHRSKLPENVSLIDEYQLTWEAFHFRWIGVAEVKKATWYLAAYTRELSAVATRFAGGVGPALEAAFAKAGTEAAAGLNQVVNFLAAVVDSIELEEFQVKLPGDLEIQRFFGELEFDRLTGDWEVGFGGRAAFPDVNVILGVPDATISSSGAFSLAVVTDGVVPFGLEDSFSLELDTFALTGNILTPTIDSAATTGRLLQGDPENPDRTYDLALSYAFLDPGHRFTFSTAFSEQGELFSPDFVIINGGFGFNLETDGGGTPTQGGLNTAMTLGMIRRPEAAAKPVDQLTATDFYLTFAGSAAVQVDGIGQTVELSLDSGTLTLPPDVFSAGDPPMPATITMNGRLCVQVSLADGSFNFCDDNGQPFRLQFSNIVGEIPGIEGSRLGVNSATLVASGASLPYLENIDAQLVLPLPGEDPDAPGQPNEFSVSLLGENWRLDGLPELATLTLDQDARLMDTGGFTLDLLGAPNNPYQGSGTDPNCDTSITLSTPPGGSVPELTLQGGLRFALEEGLLKDDTAGTAFALETCGRFDWNFTDLPTFVISTAEIAGRYRLGGSGGIGIVGRDGGLATVRFEGIENLFNLAPDRAFTVRLDGAFDIPDIASFGLIDTAFILDGSGLLFQPGGFEVGFGEKTLEAIEGLPVYVSELALEFLDPTAPFFPGAGETGLFDLTNLRIITSGGIHLPSKEAIDAGSPGISGQVQDLEITLVDVGGGAIEPRFNTNGFGMQIENLDIPPLMGLTGGLFVGNINYPQNLYFAGIVGGRVNDTSAEILLALNTDGLIGACFEIDAGPVGIPIDGGLLGGLMLTGVQGGISFENGFLDPCDFASFIRLQEVDGEKVPVNDLQEDVFMPTDPGDPPEPVTPIPWDHCLVENTGGEFPVASVNPLCEPHPTIPGRVVYKGTILTAGDLATLGITPTTVPADVEDAAQFAAGQLLSAILGLTDDPFINLLNTDPGNPAVDFVNQKVNEVLEGFTDIAATFLQVRLDDSLATSGLPPTSANLYDAIEQAVGEGVPCLDTTIRLTAKLSHAATPSMVKGDVGAIFSTTGTVVVDGDIEVSGIPFGSGEFIFQLTDQNGDVNPSFGGYANAGVGPLELGQMSFGYTCNGCTSNFFDAFATMLAGGFGANDASVSAGLIKLMDQVAPRTAPRDPGVLVTDHFNALTEPEKLGFLTSVANLFILQTAGITDPLVELFGPDPNILLDAFLDSYIQFQTQVQVNANPVFCFEQEVQPKLFGFPLGPPNFASLNYNARVNDPLSGQDFQQFSASWGFSPSALVLAVTTGGAGSLLPEQPIDDLAEMSFSYRIPSWTEERVRQSIVDPLGFTAQATKEMMADMVIGFGYAFRPLGLELANGQGRVIMPRLDAHPTNPDPLNPNLNWQLPSGPGVADRTELILAALNRGRLKDATWRGDAGELYDLFAQPGTGDYTPSAGSCSFLVDEIAPTLDEAAMNQLSFAQSYFPYGGVIGGAEISLPNFITQLPPPELLGLFAIPLNLADAEAWLANATFVFDTYLRGTTCSGQLAFHFPAPNPLQVDWATADTDDFMKALSSADFGQVVDRTLPGGVYAFDQILFSGWLQAQLLGLPLADATILFEPAATAGDSGVFLVDAQISQGTWLSDIVNANVTVEIKGPALADAGNAAEGPEDRIDTQLALTQGKTANDLLSDGGLFVNDTLDALGQMLPRASVHAGASLSIPPELETFIDLQGSTGLEFFAFSAAYEPSFMTGSDDPYAIARRRGGAGVRGNFNLGYFPDTGEPIQINIDNAAFAITPTADPSLFPALSGKVEVGLTQIPFLPTIRDGELTLNTSPDNGFPYIAVEANLDPFVFGLEGNVELLRFDSLNGPGNPIGGRLEIIRQDGAPLDTEVNMMISPMAASMPFLGPNVGVTVYGQKLPDGTFTDFSFSTSSTTQWQATVCISDPTDPDLPPSLAICDPFDPSNSACLISVAPTAPICGTIYGRGVEEFAMEVTIPGGIDVTFFPGQETEATVTLGLTDEILFYVDNTGTFFVDFGDLNVELPGVISAGGHITFGYKREGSVADVSTLPTSVNFGPVDILETNTVAVDVNNFGFADANIVFRTQPPSQFTVNSEGFRLTPGMTNSIDVIFSPSVVGPIVGELIVESNDPDTPRLSVPLNGTGTATPRYFQSRDTIAFGDTVVGGTSVGTVTIGNDGSASMQVTGITISDPSFTLDPPPGPLTLAPGESQLFRVSFTPLAKQPFNGTITVQTATIGSHNIALTGNGSDPAWLLVHDAESLGKSVNLNDIVMFDANRGWAVGDQGTLIETKDAGRSWIPYEITEFDLNTIGEQSPVGNAVLAEYHFEDTPGVSTFLDSSPNGLHGSSPDAGRAPAISYADGRYGSGIRFDGVNDYIELTDFDVPDQWSVSMWVNPDDTSTTQVLVSKNGLNGENDFFLGFRSDGFFIRLLGTAATGIGTPTTGWQYLILNVNYRAGTNDTAMQLFRDGVSLAFRTFPGKLPANGKPFSLGQEWDSATATSDFFGGAMDEVYFYRNNIPRTGPPRLVVAGDGGSVFESFTKGSNWKQLEDQRIRGWRQDLGGFYQQYEWFGAGFASDGKLLLGGERKTNNRLFMIEALDPGTASPGDEQFGDATFATAAGTGAGEILTAAIGSSTDAYAVGTRGVPYRATSTTSEVFLDGTLDVGALRDAVPTTAFDYVAVGDNGTIVTRFNAVPAVASPGLTTSHLRGIAYNPALTEELHVVGDNGAYLVSDNLGVDDSWVFRADGLEGNNRAIDVVGTGTTYEAWAVGEKSEIRYRPQNTPSGPFVAFAPGQLDFGFRLVGQSRTLPLKIYNRGNEDLVIPDIQVEGSPFSIVQGIVPKIAAGDAVTLYVRYKPTAVSNRDEGALRIVTNESGQAFRVPLTGRANNEIWEPVPVDLTGEVVDIEMLSDTFGFALVDTAGGTVLRNTSNGGVSWPGAAFVVIPELATGQKLRLNAIDFDPELSTGLHIGAICGAVLDSNDNFVRGIVLRSEGGSLWFDVTPSQASTFEFADVSILDDIAPLTMVTATADPAGNGDVWQTEDAGASWIKKQARLPGFDGSVVLVHPNPAATFDPVGFSTVFAAGRNFIFGRSWDSNWPFTGPFDNQVAIPDQAFHATQKVRAMQFMDVPDRGSNTDFGWIVGDNGLFWRLEPQVVGPSSQGYHSAGNATVLGTTDLTGVSFHDRNNGWVVGDSKIFISNDSGESWDLQFDSGDLARFNDVTARSATKAWAGGALSDQAVIWRYTGAAAPARGVLAMNDVEILDPALRDGIVTRSVTLDNLGNAPIDLHHLRLDSDDPLARFRIATSPPPASIPAGGSVTVDIEFEAVPEPPLCEDIAPEVFLRFEQDPTATVFFDDSLNKYEAVVPADPNRRPRITDGCLGRDRALHFDGNDYAEISEMTDILGDFSVALWVNPETAAAGQNFVGKHSSSGANKLLFGFYSGGYHVNLQGSQFTTAERSVPGWQHLVVTGDEEGGSTTITVWRNGEILGSSVLPRVLAANVATDKPWILGADWDSATNINDFLKGCLDEVMILGRVLSEREIQCLANHSPLYGEHRATLVVDSSAEGGTRTAELRAEVIEESNLMIFDTVPTDMPITIDGVTYQSPVSFSVGTVATNSKEWCEGSMHTIEVPDNVQLMRGAENEVEYAFCAYDCSAKPVMAVSASKEVSKLTAEFAVRKVTDLTPPAAAPPSPIPTLTQSGNGDALRQEVINALANTPQGPFFRLTGGNLTVPGLGQDGFAIDGELFLSPTRMYASLMTSPLAVPGGAGPQFLELGASCWLLDFEAGQRFILKAHPPSLELLGFDLLPDAFFCIEFYEDQTGAESFRFAVGLEDDYLPIPDFLEFKQGAFAVEYAGGAFALDWTGGVRILRLPDGTFAVDEDFALHFATPSLDGGISLKQALADAGIVVPNTLLEVGGFRIEWPNGDLSLVNDTALRLELTGIDFVVLDQPVVSNMTGSVGIDGVLAFSGNINEFDLCVSSNCFSLQTPGGNGEFLLRFAAGLPPSIQLIIPEVILFGRNGPSGDLLPGWPAAGIRIPGVDFDSSFVFDTGMLPLPVLAYDGIDLSTPDGGRLRNNHLRFVGGLERGFRFDLKAEIPPFFLCSPQQIAFYVDNLAIGGSYSGNFCFLPEPVSLSYDPLDPAGCQFQGTFFGWIVKFGSTCAEFERAP